MAAGRPDEDAHPRAPGTADAPVATRSGVAVLAAGGLGIAVMVVAILLFGRPGRLTATPRYEIPAGTTFAIASDARRIALGSDRLELRSLGSTNASIAAVAIHDRVRHLELDGGNVRYSLAGAPGIYRWMVAEDGALRTDVEDAGGAWYGRTSLGELIYNERALRIVAGTREVRVRALAHRSEDFAVSPDRRRVAFRELAPELTAIVVWDVDRDTLLRFDAVPGVTSVSWLDNTALVFATAHASHAAIYRVTVGEEIEQPRKLYERTGGAFANLRAANHRIFAIDQRDPSRVELIELMR